MKPWIPAAIAIPVTAGLATWAILADTSQHATMIDGTDPGEIACVDLVTGDYLAPIQDDYSKWGADLYDLATRAAESDDYGIATAADTVVSTAGSSFIPIDLMIDLDDLADACVAAGHITDAQVTDAKHR